MPEKTFVEEKIMFIWRSFRDHHKFGAVRTAILEVLRELGGRGADSFIRLIDRYEQFHARHLPAILGIGADIYVNESGERAGAKVAIRTIKNCALIHVSYLTMVARAPETGSSMAVTKACVHIWNLHKQAAKINGLKVES